MDGPKEDVDWDANILWQITKNNLQLSQRGSGTQVVAAVVPCSRPWPTLLQQDLCCETIQAVFEGQATWFAMFRH